MFWRKKQKVKNTDYGKAVKDIKNKNKEFLANILTVAYDVKSAVKLFNNKDLALDIPFEALFDFPLNKMININEKLKTMVIFKNDRSLIFETHMKKNGGVEPHYHKDAIEELEVISGSIIDAVNGKIYKEDEVMYVESNQIHSPQALEDTYLVTTVMKLNKNDWRD